MPERRRVQAELSIEGEYVVLKFRYSDNLNLLAECEMKPEQGYALAQNITMKCIACEEANK